jgi:pimeloyl-ACP methyl ester carboxylesterase
MRVSAHGIAIEVDDRGPPGAPAVLMIMGLAMQLTQWPEPLVGELLAKGLRVVRFDNRDAGLSQGFDALGVPSLPMAGLRHWLHLPQHPPYTLAAMAEDTLGVLDALGLAQAHVVGVSMGGMIAQHLAARHPARVASLTLMMTSSGARHLPAPAARVQRLMLHRPDPRDAQAVIAHQVRLWRAIGSPAYPAPEPVLRERLAAAHARAFRPAGTARQLLAVLADADRTPLLRTLGMPTTVIHGLADPLVRPAAGERLALQIAGARWVPIAGMGHDLPDALLPQLAAEIAATVARAGRAGAPPGATASGPSAQRG